MDTEVWSGASTLCQSQTRSWPAGQSERQYQSPPVHQGLISNEGADGRRKFQRHDLAQNVSTESTNRPGSQLFSSSGESSHDPISLQLGLSWKGISEDSDKQAAARGWAKVIERRYTIDGVRVLARHTDDLLMVEARDGIYVFDRDINRGTRIAETWTHCVEGLLSNQSFVWEGRELLHPNESPASSEAGGLWDTDDRDADMVSTLSTFQSPCTPPPPTSPAILSDPEPWSPDSLYPTGNMLDFHQPDGPSTTSDGNGLETEDIEMAVD